MFTRRDFIKMMSSFSVVVLTPLVKLMDKIPLTSNIDNFHKGELYEEFILLPKDAPLPYFIEVTPCPILCNLEQSDLDNPALTGRQGITTWFDSIDRFRENTNFPVFLPGSFPKSINFLQGYIIKYKGSGEIWEARINFGLENNQEQVIALSAKPTFSKPFPMWPGQTYPHKNQFILDDEFIEVKPEKVSFTPTPGLMLPTFPGYILLWVKMNVLYMLDIEYDVNSEFVENFCNSLIEK